MTLKTKYLIVGNSAGGIGAAETIREVDTVSSVTIISDEPYPAYSRPLISKYLTKERTLEEILFRPLDFYSQNNIVSLLGKKVKKLELVSHTAEIDSGERIVWEKLLLATGGMPVTPRIGGIGKRGVFSFTTVDDAKAIYEFLDNSRRAVVIGGGLIGVSVTEALVKQGIDVAVVEMRERILSTILDTQASSIVEEAIAREGVSIITGHTVAEVVGERAVKGVVLDNGEKITCDLVVVAIGVVPRSELAISAGIKINRGIVVDRYMKTNHPDVYSCGDAAEAYDFVHGTNQVTPIWPNAYIGGRTAGYNMVGSKRRYPGGTAMNTLNYFGLEIVSAGIVTPIGDDSCEMIFKQFDGGYRKAVLKDNFVEGMVFVGNIQKSGILFSLIRDRVNVGDFKEELVADDFGLVSLPRELWRERLETPPSGSFTQTAAPVGE